MGESSAQVECPQPKPSRFQFVPVPGEFTRGRWKCRDSYHPYAETLEFEKNKTKEEANPEKISVFFKLRQCEDEAKPSSTIQVTSVENKVPDQPEENSLTENIIITRKNGVTIVRKTSGSLAEEGYDKIRELSIDDFEHKTVKPPQVPPTPMNTPPASMTSVAVSTEVANSGESLAPKNSPNVLQSTTSEEAFAHPSRKVSLGTKVPTTELPVDLPPPKQEPRVFQVTPVVVAPVSPIPNTFEKPIHTPGIASSSEPTFQVIQTEESKNMSMDSVKNVIDIQSEDLKTDIRDKEAASDVMITVSAVAEKKDVQAETANVTINSLEAGIPITTPPTAPHSTPYGTPKDTQRSPTFDEAFSAGSPVAVPAATINTASAESSLPIDNKIEQAMELVKTHLTYAVREEVDTLRNTITELEYQMREYQFECNYYRQNCTQDVVEQASSFVRQQMSKYQQPTRRTVSAAAVILDGVPQTTAQSSTSSPHMRNLQTQIQQMKIVPGAGAVSKTINADDASAGAQTI